MTLRFLYTFAEKCSKQWGCVLMCRVNCEPWTLWRTDLRLVPWSHGWRPSLQMNSLPQLWLQLRLSVQGTWSFLWDFQLMLLLMKLLMTSFSITTLLKRKNPLTHVLSFALTLKSSDETSADPASAIVTLIGADVVIWGSILLRQHDRGRKNGVGIKRIHLAFDGRHPELDSSKMAD